MEPIPMRLVDFPSIQTHAYTFQCACGTTQDDWTLLNKNGKPAFIRKLCDECDKIEHDKRELEREAGRDIERRIYFNSKCPEIYQESDPSRLPPRQLNIIMAYEMSERGLLCRGDSRKGKTRCCWMLMKKLAMKGVKFRAMTEVEFSTKLTSFKSRDDFRHNLMHVPMFFLDDLGHVAAGARHLEELYHIVEYRTSHKLPIICTTQFSGGELMDKSNRSKTMLAIIGRMREFCDIIDFNK